jgi:hypothetical protein
VADLFDMFAPQTSPAPSTSEKVDSFDTAAVDAQATPCRTPYAASHACRVSGGHAMFSDDSGRTWFCQEHVPRGFFDKDRGLVR